MEESFNDGQTVWHKSSHRSGVFRALHGEWLWLETCDGVMNTVPACKYTSTDPNQPAEPVKPNKCPFCGSSAYVSRLVASGPSHVSCEERVCQFQGPPRSSEAKAVQAWNSIRVASLDDPRPVPMKWCDQLPCELCGKFHKEIDANCPNKTAKANAPEPVPKPCPCCRSKARIDSVRVYCPNNTCMMGPVRASKREAIAAWNKLSSQEVKCAECCDAKAEPLNCFCQKCYEGLVASYRAEERDACAKIVEDARFLVLDSKIRSRGHQTRGQQ